MQNAVDRPKQRSNFITVVREHIRAHHVSYVVQEGDISMLSAYYKYMIRLSGNTYPFHLPRSIRGADESESKPVCPFESWLESDNYDIPTR